MPDATALLDCLDVLELPEVENVVLLTSEVRQVGALEASACHVFRRSHAGVCNMERRCWLPCPTMPDYCCPQPFSANSPILLLHRSWLMAVACGGRRACALSTPIAGGTMCCSTTCTTGRLRLLGVLLRRSGGRGWRS